MKLYFSPGACSLSPHIVAREAGIELEREQVDLRAKRTASGVDFLTINPKGVVPVLVLDTGEVLTEGAAIVQYLADLKPESGLAPPSGTLARYRLQEMLSFIGTEIHKSYTPLFNPDTLDSVRNDRKAMLSARYRVLEPRLAAAPWLVGEHFTAADAYLFTVTNWAGHVGLDLSGFPAVTAFQQKVAARPHVQAALKAEGLVKN